MNFAFEMAINVLEVSLILEFLVRYFGYRESLCRWQKIVGTAALWLVSFSVIAFFSWSHVYENYASTTQVFINIAFCCLLLRGHVFQKIFLSAFTMGLVALTSTMTALLFARLSGNEVTVVFGQFSRLRVIAVLFAKVMFFLITRLILRIRENGRIRWMDLFPLAIIPILSNIAITLMTYAAMQEPRIQNLVMYAVCIVLALNILVYFLFVRLGESSRMQTEMALLSMQNECLQENAKDIQSMYDTVSALRHDLKNHLLCISAMAEEQDTDGIRRYTEQLLQQNDSSRLMIFSGNKVLDAIVNSKSSSAARAGVRLRAVITTALDGVPPEDITVILGNALDNAIRAAKDSKGRTIDLYIQPQGAYHAIEIVNDIAASVLQSNPRLHTTKTVQTHHGFGIRNMRRAVERNQGMLRFEERDGRFVCSILLLDVQSRNE